MPKNNVIRLLLAAIIFMVAAPASYAQGFPFLRVRESDNSPNVQPTHEIIVTNGTLTNNGSGTVTLTTGGGGGGGGSGLPADPTGCPGGWAVVDQDINGVLTCDTGVVVLTEIDVLSELEAIMGGINIIAATEIDTPSEFRTVTTIDSEADLETIAGSGVNIITATNIDTFEELLGIVGNKLQVGDRVITDTTGNLTTKLDAALTSCGGGALVNPNAGCRIVLGPGRFELQTAFSTTTTSPSSGAYKKTWSGLTIEGQGMGPATQSTANTYGRTSVRWCGPADSTASAIKIAGFMPTIRNMDLMPWCTGSPTASNTADVMLELFANNADGPVITHLATLENLSIGGQMTETVGIWLRGETNNDQLDFTRIDHVSVQGRICIKQESQQAVHTTVSQTECQYGYNSTGTGIDIITGDMSIENTYFGNWTANPLAAIRLHHDAQARPTGKVEINGSHFEVTSYSGGAPGKGIWCEGLAAGGSNYTVSITNNNFVNVNSPATTGVYNIDYIDCTHDGSVQISQNNFAVGGDDDGNNTSTVKIRRGQSSGTTQLYEWGNNNGNINPTWNVAGAVVRNTIPPSPTATGQFLVSTGANAWSLSSSLTNDFSTITGDSGVGAAADQSGDTLDLEGNFGISVACISTPDTCIFGLATTDMENFYYGDGSGNEFYHGFDVDGVLDIRQVFGVDGSIRFAAPAALSGNKPFAANEVGVGLNGLIAEGAADNFETYVSFTSATSSDKTLTVPDANTVTVQGTTCSGTDKVSAINATTGAVTCSADAGAGSITLTGDVDGSSGSNDLDEAAVEGELETVLDLPDLQGTLTVAKGGTGAAPGSDDQLPVSDSTTALTWRTVPNCPSTGITYTQSSNTFGCSTAVNSFATWVPTAGTSPVADSGADTITITSSDGTILVTGDQSSDTIEFRIGESQVEAILDAEDLQGAWIRRVLTSDVSTTSNSAYSALTGLNFTAGVSTNYIVRCHLVVGTADVTSGVQMQYTGPASPTQVTIERVAHENSPDRWDSAIANAFQTGSTDDAIGAGCTGRCIDTVEMVIKNGANSGTVGIGIQAETNGQSATVYSGSYCERTTF